ncbi:MAG: hypothetical protein Q8O48_03510, partial [Anaerolineales bacterium]|nr:hypothetical protein [Anaerolineales bacterium]
MEFDDDWFMNSEDWRLPVYEISDIDPNSTIIELTRLRIKIDDIKLDSLRYHLGATYSRFLKHHNLKIILNTKEINPGSFEKWAYPPDFEP